jgi:hypothetical protein
MRENKGDVSCKESFSLRSPIKGIVNSNGKDRANSYRQDLLMTNGEDESLILIRHLTFILNNSHWLWQIDRKDAAFSREILDSQFAFV